MPLFLKDTAFCLLSSKEIAIKVTVLIEGKDGQRRKKPILKENNEP